MPGDGWFFVIAVTKLSNDYGRTRVLMWRTGLILKVKLASFECWFGAVIDAQMIAITKRAI